jgi:hypothetical protein
MYKKECKISNLIATDGFHFSGSGLINDVFKDAGYVIPKNIRADELFNNPTNFSWPKAVNREYDLWTRAKLFVYLVKQVIIRIPLNILQKTPFYRHYLFRTGRGEELHQSSSVNRSLWSYVVSIRMLFHRGLYDEAMFNDWLYLKYRGHINGGSDLLLDNGIPKNLEIARWFFNISRSMGIIVYRNPRVQYQQIIQVYRSTGKTPPNYYDFLLGLSSQYSSMGWLLDSNFNIIFVSFDQLLNDKAYRDELLTYFKSKNIVSEIKYDFSRSYKNNLDLIHFSEEMVIDQSCMKLEMQVLNFHKTFANQLKGVLYQ